MSLLLRLDPVAGPILEGEPAAAPTVGPRDLDVAGGRGDARIATYVKKPVVATEGPDWAAEGYVTLADFGARNGAPVLLPTDDPFALQGRLAGVGLIAVYFPKFADGRGYSTAAILRQRLGYTGDLRAVGDVQRDQIFYLARCGFTSFALKDGQDGADALKALKDFSVSYQASADGQPPLFRRRG